MYFSMIKHNKPLIGITTDYENNNKSYSKYPWFALRENYVKSLEKLGANCVILPLSNNIMNLKLLDGLVITGGNFDIDPKYFGQKIKSNKIKLKSKRTIFELKLIKKFIALNKPILGICGGAQLINVFQKGTLIQDIKSYLNHEQKNPRNETSHEIQIIKNSYISKIYKKKIGKVNSAHHQAVNKLGKDLELSAKSKDGIIEAFYHKKHPYCVGVQWHPEFLITKLDINLIKDFVKNATFNIK